MEKILLKNCSKLHTLNENLDKEIGTLENYSVLIQGERIDKIDKFENLEEFVDENTKIIDCKDKTVLPGFIDPHTHLVFGGDRKEEYMARLTIKDDDIIKKRAGTLGMAGSVEKTKEAGFDGLMESSVEKLNDLLLNGITTVEIKSGYGIDKDIELMQLRVVQELKEKVSQTLFATYLGGHDWDKKMGKDQYVEFCIKEVMPIIEKENLADFADIWVEEQFFSVEQGRRYLQEAKKHGMNGTIHGNELSSIGATKMAAEEGVYSVAHLNYITDEEIDLMVKNHVVGIILPTTDYVKQYLNVLADGRKLIDRGVTIALATNINPGNYSVSMSLVMNMACRNHGLSGEEALRGSTINGAKALRIQKDYGSIEEGKFADIQIWNTDDYRNVIYKQGYNFVETVIKHGSIVVEDKKLV